MYKITFALTLLALLIALPAKAQENHPLRAAVVFYTATATADTVSTVYGLHTCKACEEKNPLYSWGGKTTVPLALGIGVDVLTVWTCEKFLARKHPKFATIGLYVFGSLRLYTAAANVRLAQNY